MVPTTAAAVHACGASSAACPLTFPVRQRAASPTTRETRAHGHAATRSADSHDHAQGRRFCHVLIDYGPESDLCWTVFITQTGEIWTCANHQVRAGKNITLGRTHPTLPVEAAAPIPFRGSDPAAVAGSGER